MKIRALLLPGAALGAAALLLTPTESQGFTTIGGSLNTFQRDVRVFDNFTDSASNNNTTEDPQFPGYTGVELAVWKAGVEWGSLPHGDGTGDTTQTVLGDGGANFDMSWQGNATSVGNSNENIVSVISSCGGGTLAFTETPISDGWRIRFCDNWVWHDGPGFISSGGSDFDIQEVQTHEYGHALGLGHSSNGSATMRPATGAGSIGGRSIHSDDIAGVQFIYGLAAAGKPVITSVSGLTTLTIVGQNFSSTGNEVWFTQENAGGTGVPVKVTNVSSSAGNTVIVVSVPAAAGSGDVLVKKSGNTTGDTLSNAFPWDSAGDPPMTYCFGKISSAFCGPYITWTGSPSATDTNAFQVIGNDIVPDQFGFLIYSINGPANLNFHNGTLCIKTPFTRLLPPKNSGSPGMGFCPGELSTNFNKRIQSGLDATLTVGQQVNAQWYYRDPGVDSFNDGLTDGIEFTILP